MHALRISLGSLLALLALVPGVGLAQDTDESLIYGMGAGRTTMAPRVSRSFPRELPVDLPDLAYRVHHAELGPRVGRPGWFDPLKDGAAFSNHLTPRDGSHAGYGVCGGLSLMAFAWYHKIVVPVRNDDDEVSGAFGRTLLGRIPATIDQGNLERYRLHAYSTPMDQRVDAVRRAINFHRVWNEMSPPVEWGPEGGNHAYLWEKIREHLEDATESLTPIWFRLVRPNGQGTAHAVLVHRGYHARAEAAGGPSRHVIYLPIMDPNVVIRPDNYGRVLRTRYLMYFPDVHKFSWGGEYRDSWARSRVTIQTGTYLADREIGYMPYYDYDPEGSLLQRSTDASSRFSDEDLQWTDRETHN